MTELEQFAAALLSQWRASGGADEAPIAVGALLDKVLPYRRARRTLGIDASEDYEALVLRLIAEDEDLMRTDPVSAADMAKVTITSRLPDLDALQLLRSAKLTFVTRAVARLDDASSRADAPPPVVVDEPPVRAQATPPVEEEPSSRAQVTQRVAAAEGPPSPRNNDVIPLYPTQAPVAEVVAPAAPAAPPADASSSRAKATQRVAAVEGCWSCSETLPVDRAVKFCPFCGADQRQPTCAACGAAAERGWKHCPECGAKL